MFGLRRVLTSVMVVSWFVLVADLGSSYEKGQIVIEEQVNYVLSEKLGSGDFGEVWVVYAQGHPENRHAVKFYFRPSAARMSYEKYKKLFDIQERGGYGPELLQLTPPGRSTVVDSAGDVVRESVVTVWSEVVTGSLSSRRSEYGLQNKRSIKKLRGLMYDVAHGMDSLYRLGLSHMDITPKNILLDEGRHLLGDLDSVTEIGKNSPSVSWEVKYAPVEYSDGRRSPDYSHSHLGDAWGLGAVLFELITGESPLVKYSRSKGVADRFGENALELRADMHLNPRSHHGFSECIRSELQLAVDKRGHITPSEEMMIVAVIRYIQSSLILDIQTRKSALTETSPFLRMTTFEPDLCSRLEVTL